MLTRKPKKDEYITHIDTGLVLKVGIVSGTPYVNLDGRKVCFGDRTYSDRKHMFSGPSAASEVLQPVRIQQERSNRVPEDLQKDPHAIQDTTSDSPNIKTFAVLDSNRVQIGELKINVSMLGTTKKVTVIPLEEQIAPPLVVAITKKEDTVTKLTSKARGFQGTWTI